MAASAPDKASQDKNTKYLQEKKIPSMVDGLIRDLLDEKPEDPYGFCSQWLMRKKREKENPAAGPAEPPPHPIPYFDLEPFWGDNMGKWAKDGDVIVSCAAKCGTNWMLNCVHQIRTHGDDNALDVNVVTPWIGLKHKPGETWAENWNKMNNLVFPEGTDGAGTKLKDHWDNPKYPYRAFKSHFAPKVPGGGPDCCLEPRKYPGVKFVAMAREGKDVARSFAPFFANHSEEWRELWGGFPPVFPTNEAAVGFMQDGPGQGLYFGYLNTWWPLRHDPNVLLLHFADAKRDLDGFLRKLASFVGVQVPEDKWAGVVERCGFPWMKKNQTKFHYRVWGNEVLDKKNFKIMKDIDGSIIRKGIVGDHEGFFTPEMTKMWEESVEKHFGHDPDMKRWAAEGNEKSPGIPF